MTHNLILGTAGHIDHGKTSLIRALTGKETDRLPEEKKRGITIELGYADLTIGDTHFGIVDVPGHEKFVRQMLAGATGMDLVMLVVAADDSVKPQTIEHLEILRLLDLQNGLIVLTKCDTADEEWLDLVEEEIRDAVADTFLERASVFRTSATTGEGIADLRTELGRMAEQIASSSAWDLNAPFRMAMDRVFTVAGHGTVVTGSVSSGTVRVGDSLEIQPGDINVRVRGVHNHDAAVESIGRGQRGAINLGGVHHGEIGRGMELAATGLLNASRSMILDVQLLPEVRHPLLDRQRIRFHLGTAEIIGFIRILRDRQDCGRDSSTEAVSDARPEKDPSRQAAARAMIEPGQSGIVQIFMREPAVAVWSQPFVIRSESPVRTLGGGRVIHPFSPRINRRHASQVAAARRLTSDNPAERISALIYLSPVARWNRNDLAAASGAAQVDELIDHLVETGQLVRVPLSSSRSVIVHRLHLDEIQQVTLERLNRFHDENPLASGNSREQLLASFNYLPHDEIINLALDELLDQKQLIRQGELLGVQGRGPQLSKNEQALLAGLTEQIWQAGLQPPTPAELQKAAAKNKDSVPKLLQLAVDRGDLIRITNDYLIHRQVLVSLQQDLTRLLESQNGATMSEIRQKIDVSRKYAVPLCEYLDTIRFTRRDGDMRFLEKSP